MNERIDGAGRKDAIRKRIKQAVDKNNFIRKKLRHGKAKLRVLFCDLCDGEARHFAAGAARCRNRNKLSQFRKRCPLFIDLFAVIISSEYEQFTDIQNRAAANRKDTIDLFASDLIQHTVNHDIRRLPAAEFLLKYNSTTFRNSVNLQHQYIFIRYN